jgi:hypothetical protein
MKIASINDILATRARATFSHRINFDKIELDNVDTMRKWCEQNCQGIWRCEVYYALYFQFELDTDATMFMLRWGGAKGNKLK